MTRQMNPPSGPRLRLLSASTALALLWALPGQAQVWDGGAGTSSWHDAANWDTDTVPGSATAASIIDSDVVISGGTAATAILQLGYGVVGGTATYGNGTLTVTNGARLTSTSSYVSRGLGYTNSLTLTGASNWSSTGTLTVSSAGTGTLSILEGSTVSVTGAVILASSSNSTMGTVIVSGAGSSLAATGTISMSRNAGANSTLVIADGGSVSASGLVFYQGPGTLIFGAAAGEAATAPGSLTLTSGITFRQGTSTIIFNHTGTNANPLVLDTAMTRSSGTPVFYQLAGVTQFASDLRADVSSTQITGGSLLVTGTLLGSLNVSGAGRLGGTGTVGTVTVYPGGTLAPGLDGQTGMLTVSGDLILASGSTYAVAVGANGDSDLTVVGGNAYISGDAVLSISALPGVSYATGWTHTVLQAASISGTFNSATQVTGDFATFTTSYSNTAVSVAISALGGASATILREEQSVNQKAVATALESIGLDTPLYNAAFLAGAGQSGAALDAFSGGIYPSTRTALMMESHFLRGAINNRLRHANGDLTGLGGEEGADPEAPRAWGSAFGFRGELESDGNSGALDTRTTGFVLGFDALTEAGVRIGIAGAKLDSSYDGSGASADGSGYHLALYGGAEWGALALRSGLVWGRSKVSILRDINIGLITNSTFSDSLNGDYRANTKQAFAELGYRIDRGALRLEPFADLAHVQIDTDLVNEEGGSAALTVEEADLRASFATLGIRAARDFDLGASRAAVSGSVGWRHALGDANRSSVQSFGSGDAFTVFGLPIAQDVVVVEAGVDVVLSPNATLGVSYSGQHGSESSSHGVNARFNLRF